MKRYIPSVDEDRLVLAWALALNESGDADAIFHDAPHAPSDILAVVQPPAALYYSADAAGIATALWFEPWMGCAVANVWARPDHRPPAWAPAEPVFREVFAEAPVVLSLTDDARITRFWKRHGFTVTPRIPYLFQGRAAWAGHLTRDTFLSRHGGQLEWTTNNATN